MKLLNIIFLAGSLILATATLAAEETRMKIQIEVDDGDIEDVDVHALHEMKSVTRHAKEGHSH